MPNIFSRIKKAKDTLSPFYYSGIRQFHLSKELMTYETAIQKLNSLQSNATVLELAKQKGKASHVELASKLDSTIKYLQRTGVTLEKLDRLSIIHVSGTKGKGTTCALCESILRHHGYKTGFYSSPHLVHAKERIRINGIPLSYQQFSDYFEEVYDKIADKKEHNDDMPPYFKFMTILAFNVFIKEQVDVAIVEVGIGGEYDCTNCIRNPAVVGITSLGLDHTCILGNTISEIAWQKAGIMKPNSVAFTVPQKSSAAMQVLKERAQNRRCKLYISPSLNSYLWDSSIGIVRDNDNVQALNYSLALQLANEWMKLQSPFHEKIEEKALPEESFIIPTAKAFQVTKKMVDGLKNCSWPGRSQIMVRDKITYFLDGAHTEESIKYCTHWFRKCSRIMETEIPALENVTRILVFNTTGQRDSNKFLEILSGISFDYAIFTANKCQSHVPTTSEPESEAEKGAQDNLELWRKWVRIPEQDKFMGSEQSLDNFTDDERNPHPSELPVPGGRWKTARLPTMLTSLQEHGSTVSTISAHRKTNRIAVKLWNEKSYYIRIISDLKVIHERPRKTEEAVTRSVSEALAEVNNIAKSRGMCHVLITGSLHLIGNSLSLLDPELLEPVYHLPTQLKPLQDVYSGLQAIL